MNMQYTNGIDRKTEYFAATELNIYILHIHTHKNIYLNNACSDVLMYRGTDESLNE